MRFSRGPNARGYYTRQNEMIKGVRDSPDHGYANRPRSISDAEPEIGVVCSLVFSLLHIMYDFREFPQNILCDCLNRVNRSIGIHVGAYLGSKLLEQRLQIFGGLDLRRRGELPLGGTFDVI